MGGTDRETGRERLGKGERQRRENQDTHIHTQIGLGLGGPLERLEGWEQKETNSRHCNMERRTPP